MAPKTRQKKTRTSRLRPKKLMRLLLLLRRHWQDALEEEQDLVQVQALLRAHCHRPVVELLRRRRRKKEIRAAVLAGRLVPLPLPLPQAKSSKAPPKVKRTTKTMTQTLARFLERKISRRQQCHHHRQPKPTKRQRKTKPTRAVVASQKRQQQQQQQGTVPNEILLAPKRKRKRLHLHPVQHHKLPNPLPRST